MSSAWMLAIEVLRFLMIGLNGWMLYLAVSWMIQAKEPRRYRLLLYAGCMVLLGMPIFIGDIANLSMAFLFFMVCICTAGEGSFLKRATMGMMISSTVFAFNGALGVGLTILYFGWKTWGGIRDDITELGVGIGMLAARGIFAVLFYAGVQVSKVKKETELAPALWRLLLQLICFPLGVVIALVLVRSPFSSDWGTFPADMLLFILAMLSITGLLRAVGVFDRQQRLEEENMLAQYNRKYYETMEQHQFEVRRMKHDLRNHLLVLESLTEERRQEYRKQLLENPDFSQVIFYCADPTVNAVLTVKTELMRQREIDFSVKADIKETLPFEQADICALFANALDNAAEGCGALPEEQRKVTVEARAGKGMLVVRVTNPVPKGCEGGADGGLPETTKADTANHGFGLKSIRKVAQKYGGDMEIERKETVFSLFVWVPVTAEEKIGRE